MGLTPEQIKALLNKPATKRGGPRKPKVVARNYESWFDLPHFLTTDDKQEMCKCDNPDCIDPRNEERGQVTVLINEKHMCRFCFLDGWLTENPDQESLITDES